MRSVSKLFRLFLGILASIVLIAVMPIYDQPLGGCTSNGFATLELGCTLWLDVLLGFGVVFLVACIGPGGWRPQLWGMAIVFVAASIGGLPAIKSGVYLDAFSHPVNMVFYWKGAGIATFVGGLLGGGFYYLLIYKSRSK